MRSGSHLGQLLALWGLALVASACYSPDLTSGELRCSTSGSCPDGYRCLAADQTCWKNGESPMTDAGSDSGPAVFVGHWIYQAGSTEKVTCTDGSTTTTDLSNDYVDVTSSGGTLTAAYFCPWIVTLDAKMTSTVIMAGQSCARDMTDAKTGVTHFTWRGTTFDMTTTGATTATLQATIGETILDDAIATGCGPTTTPCAGTCTVKITGTLDKSP